MFGLGSFCLTRPPPASPKSDEPQSDLGEVAARPVGAVLFHIFHIQSCHKETSEVLGLRSFFFFTGTSRHQKGTAVEFFILMFGLAAGKDIVGIQ